MEEGLKSGALHPRNAKIQAAMGIVARYHGADAAQAAFDEFERMFVKKDIPDEIEETTLEAASPVLLVVDVLAQTGLAPSKGEAKRLIQGGGVSIDGERVTDINQTVDISAQRLFKVGKRKFLKIQVK
jgi:tyrosyl-tRNA synthetase